MRRGHQGFRLGVILGTLLLGSLVSGIIQEGPPGVGHVEAAVSAIPGQFIARLYTEALGSVPDPSGWQEKVQLFQEQGCNSSTLRGTIQGFYTSPEFLSLGYDQPAALLALYRGALKREPDRAGFNKYLVHPGPWGTLVTDFLADPNFAAEFQALFAEACAVGESPFYKSSGDGWGTAPVIALPTTGPADPWVFHGGAGSELNALLAQAAISDVHTVFLAQKAVVWLTETVVIPTNITLTTWFSETGPITPTRYALMGRLVRRTEFENRFHEPMVVLRTGSSLEGVWVDGQFAQIGEYLNGTGHVVNVAIEDDGSPSGVTTRVAHCRVSDTPGWSNIYAPGLDWGFNCQDSVIAHNLITGYANRHYSGALPGLVVQWADGISVGCAHTVVENNQVIDASDVGIVVFRSSSTTTQQSQVRYNTVLNAGNSAWGAYGTDPGALKIGEPGILEFAFNGTVFERNTFWTAPSTHLDLALWIGARAYQGDRAHFGRGAAFQFNTTGNQKVNSNTPIGVSGMYDALVYSNTLNANVLRTCPCSFPHQPAKTLIVASVGLPHRWASFVAPVPVFEDASISHCAEHGFRLLLPFIPKGYQGKKGLQLPPSPVGGYPLPPKSLPSPTPAPGYPEPAAAPPALAPTLTLTKP